MNINNLKEYKLDNGLVVAIKNIPGFITSGLLRVNFGVYHEKKGEEGLAHFLEHCLVTGGSKKYDIKSSDDLRAGLGYTNANTELDKINFIGKMLSEDLRLWLDFISDSIFNPKLDNKRFNGEKSRVLREILDKKSNPHFKINQEIIKSIYRGHPKSRFIIGNENVISETKEDKLKEFHSRGFFPNNMDLILVGDLPRNIFDLIETNFGKYKSGDNTRVDNFPLLTPLEEKVIYHENVPGLYNKEHPEESSAFIRMGLIFPPYNNKDSLIFSIISHLLGGNSNSRLFKEFGLERGLAYNTSTKYEGFYNAGELNIELQVPAIKIEDSINVLFDIFKKFREEKINDKELDIIKKITKYSFLSDMGSNEGFRDIIIRKLDYRKTPEDYINEIKNITPKKLISVANKYLPKNREEGKYILSISDPLKK